MSHWINVWILISDSRWPWSVSINTWIWQQVTCCRMNHFFIKPLSISLVKAYDLLFWAVLFQSFVSLNMSVYTQTSFFYGLHCQQWSIPHIYRLSLVLPHSLESFSKEGVCVLCLSPWGWNTRLIPYKQVNRKGAEMLKGFYICHVTRKLFLPPVEFYIKCT